MSEQAVSRSPRASHLSKNTQTYGQKIAWTQRITAPTDLEPTRTGWNIRQSQMFQQEAFWEANQNNFHLYI